MATAFLLLGANNYEEQDKQALEMDIVDEQLDTLGRSLLGMTLGCARCHDHKFDPIPTRDYYALAGILAQHAGAGEQNRQRGPLVRAAYSLADCRSSTVGCRSGGHRRSGKANQEVQAVGRISPKASSLWPVCRASCSTTPPASGSANGSNPTPSVRISALATSSTATRARGARRSPLRPSSPRPGSTKFAWPIRPMRIGRPTCPSKFSISTASTPSHVDQRLIPPIEGHFVSVGRFRFDPTNQWYVRISNEGTEGSVVVDAVQFLPVSSASRRKSPKPRSRAKKTKAEKDAEAKKLAEDSPGLAPLEKELKELEERVAARPQVISVEDAQKVGDCPICIRGNAHQPGEVVPRGFLQVASSHKPVTVSSTESGRRELAAWIVSDENPLTSRVIVNRVWAHLFGAGLVAHGR